MSSEMGKDTGAAAAGTGNQPRELGGQPHPLTSGKQPAHSFHGRVCLTLASLHP